MKKLMWAMILFMLLAMGISEAGADDLFVTDWYCTVASGGSDTYVIDLSGQRNLGGTYALQIISSDAASGTTGTITYADSIDNTAALRSGAEYSAITNWTDVDFATGVTNYLEAITPGAARYIFIKCASTGVTAYTLQGKFIAR